MWNSPRARWTTRITTTAWRKFCRFEYDLVGIFRSVWSLRVDFSFVSRSAHRNDVLFPVFLDSLIGSLAFASFTLLRRQGYNVNFSRRTRSGATIAHARRGTMVADYYRDYHNYDNYVASASVIKRRPARGTRTRIKVIPISLSSSLMRTRDRSDLSDKTAQRLPQQRSLNSTPAV